MPNHTHHDDVHDKVVDLEPTERVLVLLRLLYPVRLVFLIACLGGRFLLRQRQPAPVCPVLVVPGTRKRQRGPNLGFGPEDVLQEGAQGHEDAEQEIEIVGPQLEPIHQKQQAIKMMIFNK